MQEVLDEIGARGVRTRVGHSFIKAVMAQESAVFGGEHSAHYYFRDFWFADTGMLAAMHVLAALGGQDAPLSALVSTYDRYVSSGEINSTVADPSAALAAVRSWSEAQGLTLDELDGITATHAAASGPHWWLNVRAVTNQSSIFERFTQFAIFNLIGFGC